MYGLRGGLTVATPKRRKSKLEFHPAAPDDREENSPELGAAESL